MSVTVAMRVEVRQVAGMRPARMKKAVRTPVGHVTARGPSAFGAVADRVQVQAMRPRGQAVGTQAEEYPVPALPGLDAAEASAVRSDQDGPRPRSEVRRSGTIGGPDRSWDGLPRHLLGSIARRREVRRFLPCAGGQEQGERRRSRSHSAVTLPGRERSPDAMS